MYRREKQSKQETHHTSSKVLHNMPSFSSTLLEEIYRSIDGNVDKTEHSKVYKEKQAKTTSSRKVHLVDKWVHEDEKVIRDNDALLFSSTCSSTDSSGQLSSSDSAEFFGTQKESKVSGLSTRLKPVRTGKQGLFDDYQSHQKKANDDELIKSKSKAMKIYSHLKKMKQPISPGVRLANFINTLFSTSSGKNAKNVENHKGLQDTKSSSACSFSRSYLNKCSPRSREKINDGIQQQRTVRFQPVSVIIDQDSRTYNGKKCTTYNDVERHGKPPLPPNALPELKQNMQEKNRRIEEAVQKVLDGYNRQSKDERKVLHEYNHQKKEDSSMFHQKKEEYSSMFRRKCADNKDEDEDDAMSDSSSDLFELDHLAPFRNNNTFCEELPVYETTQFESKRAILRGLIR